MTGLYPEKDKILEVATIITDDNLNIIAECPAYAVHQSDAILDGMDEWCKKTHGDNKLTDRVKKSSLSEGDVENHVIKFISSHVKEGVSPMCGNSIGQDRSFLYHYMRKLHDYFHYRNIDVSTLKELAKRWNYDVYKGFQKKANHKALDDIKDSIKEMRHYKECFLTCKTPNL